MAGAVRGMTRRRQLRLNWIRLSSTARGGRRAVVGQEESTCRLGGVKMAANGMQATARWEKVGLLALVGRPSTEQAEGVDVCTRMR